MPERCVAGKRPPHSQGIAFRRLGTNHMGAQIRQQFRAVDGLLVRQIDDFDARKRSGHVQFSSTITSVESVGGPGVFREP